MVSEYEPGDSKRRAHKVYPLDRHIPLDVGQNIRGHHARRNCWVLLGFLVEEPFEGGNAQVICIRVAGEDDAGARAGHVGFEFIVASRENFVAFR